MLSTGMLAWRLNAGFGTSEYRLLQPYLSCMIERAPTRGRNRRGDWIRSHAWEGSESKHVEWKAARVDGHIHGRTVKARMSNREPRAWMDRDARTAAFRIVIECMARAAAADRHHHRQS